ncbi:MAG: response regulator [Cytophagales bacterium]|nr:response regulator [Cytophaga sp.]
MEKKNTICIVDDDEIFQFITRKSFERLNRSDNILIFSNGEEAIHYIQDAHDIDKPIPDIIFLDINMPVMDGWDFMDQFAKVDLYGEKAPDIYMVSSSIDDKDLHKAKSLSMVKDYITKPIDDLKIREILNGLN